MPALKLDISITDWAANSLGLESQDDWKAWAQSQDWPTEGKIAVSNIPAMMRRRMSSLSKYAVQTALELLKEYQVNYIVFASRHGELARSAQLIEDIVQGEEASPMAFSQSVHNTAAGLTTIASKQAIPVTSIAAGDNTFQMALLDAYIYLEEHPDHKVLFVDFDEPLPSSYGIYESHQFAGYAVGFVLSQGHQFEAQLKSEIQEVDSSLPQGLEFLRNYLSKQNTWQLHSKHQQWLWRDIKNS